LDEFQSRLIDLLPRLRRFARAICGDASDADDLVQTAVERALQRQGQWRPGTRLDSWMFTIMKHAWIDETRMRGRTARVLDSGADAERVADPASPSMETRLEAAAAERALAGLPQDQRLAVALVLVDGLSYREAAEVLEIPMGTLTSRLVRGRMAILAQLEGAGG
jgi:RNA polymerase sigma factor (sigma-70 family)